MVTVKDNVVTSVTATTEEKVDKVDDSMKEKETLTSTIQESITPAITEAQEEVDKGVQVITNSEENLQDKDETEKVTDAVEKQDEQPAKEDSKCLQSSTEVASAEVSMEMDDLVVHTVDEDDFKIEEQSRAHVSKKSGELPSSTTDEQVSNKVVVSYYGDGSTT